MSLLENWTLGYAQTHTHTHRIIVYIYVNQHSLITTCRPASVFILIYATTYKHSVLEHLQIKNRSAFRGWRYMNDQRPKTFTTYNP